eukprot:COSAG04_NODE_24665_length_318_cov_1.173516_1_plen_57_part_10
MQQHPQTRCCSQFAFGRQHVPREPQVASGAARATGAAAPIGGEGATMFESRGRQAQR